MSFLIKFAFPVIVTSSAVGLGANFGSTEKTEEVTQQNPVLGVTVIQQPAVEVAEQRDTRVTEPDTQPTIIPAVEEKGNCQIIDTKEDLVGTFSPEETTFVSVICTNVVDQESMLSKWTGFFPISLFNLDSQSSLSIGKKFDIDIEEPEPTDEDTEPYKTVFKSEKFVDKSIIGTWGNEVAEDVTYKDKTIYEVLLTDQVSKLYLYSHQQ